MLYGLTGTPKPSRHVWAPQAGAAVEQTATPPPIVHAADVWHVITVPVVGLGVLAQQTSSALQSLPPRQQAEIARHEPGTQDAGFVA